MLKISPPVSPLAVISNPFIHPVALFCILGTILTPSSTLSPRTYQLSRHTDSTSYLCFSNWFIFLHCHAILLLHHPITVCNSLLSGSLPPFQTMLYTVATDFRKYRCPYHSPAMSSNWLAFKIVKAWKPFNTLSLPPSHTSHSSQPHSFSSSNVTHFFSLHDMI